jgi:hypothetical protein
MKKLTLAILMLASLVYSKEKVEMTIVSIDSDGMGATLKGDGNVQKGVTGIVVTKLDGQRDIIVAAARAVSSGNEIKVRFEMFDDLAQEALPRAIIFPKVGDKAIFYLFDDRATIIAKNQADYQKVVVSDNKTWIHPDLFAALLTKERVGEPKAKHFASFCKLYAVGAVYFAIKDKVYITDCQSLEVLEERAFASENSKNFESPFFKRTGEIETGYMGMMKEKVKDFDSYYSALIGR